MELIAVYFYSSILILYFDLSSWDSLKARHRSNCWLWQRLCPPFLPSSKYFFLVYTTQVNSAFHALWLVNSEVISKYYSPPSNRLERCWNVRHLVTHKVTFSSAMIQLVCYVLNQLFTSVLGKYPSLFTSTSVNNF